MGNIHVKLFEIWTRRFCFNKKFKDDGQTHYESMPDKDQSQELNLSLLLS